MSDGTFNLFPLIRQERVSSERTLVIADEGSYVSYLKVVLLQLVTKPIARCCGGINCDGQCRN